KTELNDLRGNLPDEYVPAVVSKRGADGDNITDQQGSGLIQHEPIHYTGTDPANPKTLPNQVFSNYVPYFEPMKFNFNYHFLGAKTSAAFINPDPFAQRDPHWNNNGRSAVNVDRTPQGAERGVTFFFMDTFSPSYAAQYFRPDHYHYWGSFNHISDPDTGGGNEIDDARGWGGRYRFYFQDLGSAPSFYERENWLREEVVGQDGAAG